MSFGLHCMFQETFLNFVFRRVVLTASRAKQVTPRSFVVGQINSRICTACISICACAVIGMLLLHDIVAWPFASAMITPGLGQGRGPGNFVDVHTRFEFFL